MKTDVEIKEAVLAELTWQPNIEETEIGVIVEDGVVTLNGVVKNFTKKLAAENAVKGVQGVKAIANDIEVKLGDDFKRTDKEIAKAVVKALEWNSLVPEKELSIKVENGSVFLSGKVKRQFQRSAAEEAIHNLLGVKKVVNNIQLEQGLKPSMVKENIKMAFERSAEIDADNLTVLVNDHIVTLEGNVHSLQEKEDAEDAAYRAPGVRGVKNRLKVLDALDWT